MSEKVRVELDHDLCYGTANCIQRAKGAFELDNDGLSVLVDPDSVDPEQLRLAARDCPSGAIEVFDVEDS